MSHEKDDQSLTPNVFGALNEDVAGVIASHSSVNTVLNLMYVSKTTYHLFKPSLTLVLAMKAQACVIKGDWDGLAKIAGHKSDALFEKLPVAGLGFSCIAYNLSPYQLYIFCKGNKEEIELLIPERLKEKLKAQHAELGVGGPDLVMISFDPIEAAEEAAKSIFIGGEGSPYFPQIEKSLLENKDGIIFYLDEKKNKVNFYYANRETKEISKLKWAYPSYPEEEQETFGKFIESFLGMEDNSSRRSSDAEHELIKKVLNRELHRDGIQYELRGIRYHDGCAPAVDSRRAVNSIVAKLQLNLFKVRSRISEAPPLMGMGVFQGTCEEDSARPPVTPP